MGLFGGKPKKTAKKTNPDHLIQKYLAKTYLDALKSSPDLARKVAFKHAGVEDVLASEDPIKAKQRELDAKLTDKALKYIEGDGELQERFVEMQVSKLLGEPKPRHRGRDEGYEREDFENPDEFETYRKVKELIAEEKGDGGGGDKLLNSEVVKSAIENIIGPMIRNMFAPKAPPDGQIYIVDTPEGVMKTDAAGFQKYLEDKQRKKLQAPKPPEATPVVTAPETEQLASPTSATILTEPFVATQTLPASPPPPVSIDFSTMVEFVENDPSQFVAHLTELVANGDQQAITILGLLKSSTADELIATLQPYKVAGYQEPIEILEKNKEWLEQVIALLKAEEKHDG